MHCSLSLWCTADYRYDALLIIAVMHCSSLWCTAHHRCDALHIVTQFDNVMQNCAWRRTMRDAELCMMQYYACCRTMRDTEPCVRQNYNMQIYLYAHIICHLRHMRILFATGDICACYLAPAIYSHVICHQRYMRMLFAKSDIWAYYLPPAIYAHVICHLQYMRMLFATYDICAYLLYCCANSAQYKINCFDNWVQKIDVK